MSFPEQGAALPTFTEGSIPFSDAAGALTEDTNLNWDDTNKSLSSGSFVPTSTTIPSGADCGIYSPSPTVIGFFANGQTLLSMYQGQITSRQLTYNLQNNNNNKLQLGATNTSGTLAPFKNSQGKLYTADLTNGLVIGTGSSSPVSFLINATEIGKFNSDSGGFSFTGQTAKTLDLNRHTTANTAGNSLTIQAGGATSAATDKNGGQLLLKPGISTGTGESGVAIQGCPAGSTGTADGTPATMIEVLGNKIGLFGVTPVVRPTALTAQLTTITHTAPGTPDYAVQDLTQATPWGFASQDEGNTVLSVIANLQTRVGELETKLQGLGALT